MSSAEPVAPAGQPLVFRDVTADPVPAPAAPRELATADGDEDDFGEVVLSADPLQPPSLVSRTTQGVAAAAVEAASSPIAPAEPSAPPPVESAPLPAETAAPAAPAPAIAASVAGPGQPLPRPLPLGIVVARERPALGASSVATQLIPDSDAGL